MPKTDRICIIGAGPGGLATALALKEAGYTNVTVYEKTGRVGGQVFSGKYLTPGGKEIIYERCALQPMGSRYLNRIIKHYDLHYADTKKTAIYSLVDRELFFQFTPKMLLNPYLFIDICRLGFMLLKHRQLWKPGFENFSRTDELATPFEEWIEQKKFRSPISILLRYVINGLISFQKPNKAIPACYGFKILIQALKPPIRYINGTLKQIAEGYQEVWNRVAKDLHVQYRANISKITRTDHEIMVTVNDEPLQFDKLIIACQEYTDFLDCTEDEKIVQAQKKTIGSLRVAFLAKNCPIRGVRLFPDPLRGKRPYQCVAMTYYCQLENDLQFFTAAYVLPDDAENMEEKIIDATKEVLSIFGGEFVEIVSTHKQENYAGYFSSEAVKEGIFERSEARQGVKNTYFVGEMLSTGTNAIIVDYAYALVKRFF